MQARSQPTALEWSGVTGVRPVGQGLRTLPLTRVSALLDLPCVMDRGRRECRYYGGV